MIDYHVHTNLSYCAEKDLCVEFYAVELTRRSEPEMVYITDHSMAIYFPEEIAWKWEFISDYRLFEQWRDFGNQRLSNHIENIEKLASGKIFPGIETEITLDGHFCFDQSLRDKLYVIIGSVHYLPPCPKEDILSQWLNNTFSLLNSGIDILGHPFRWIAQQLPLSEKVIRDVVKEASRNGVALELNSHYKHPEYDVLMLQFAEEFDAKVSIASDSHRREQFGDYSYHLNLIEQSKVDFKKLELRKIPHVERLN